MVVSDKKKEQIIDGAIKKFIHYGFNKTTMNDIAEDLSVSKPSLYYYFPDKKSIIVGVIEKIYNEYNDEFKSKVDLTEDIEVIFNKIINIKDYFFRKYYLLRMTEGIPDVIMNDDNLKDIINNLKSQEQKYYMDVFTRAQKRDEIVCDDISSVAQLYVESLIGFEFTCIMRSKKNLIPTDEHFDQIVSKQRELTRIFLKGLKA